MPFPLNFLPVGMQLAERVAYLFLSPWGCSWQSVWRIYFSPRGDAVGRACGVFIAANDSITVASFSPLSERCLF